MDNLVSKCLQQFIYSQVVYLSFILCGNIHKITMTFLRFNRTAVYLLLFKADKDQVYFYTSLIYDF